MEASRCCFVLPSAPLLHRPAPSWSRATCRRPRLRMASDSGEDGPEGRQLSKTEQLARKMGKDTDAMKRNQEALLAQKKIDDRNKYLNLAVSTAIALFVFAIDRFGSQSSISVMNVLRQTSAPIADVGSNGRPSLVDFSANWCTTCREMAPNMFEIAKTYSNDVNFVVVDGDNPENADFLEKYGVDGIPQLSFVDARGNILTNFIGYVPKSIIVENLDVMVHYSVKNGGEAPLILPHKGISNLDLQNAFGTAE